MEFGFLHFPPEAVHVDAQRFGSLPESAQAVFFAIRDHGPVTHADLREHTGMPPRTIRFAVRRLKDERFIDTRCSLRDCRTCYFFVHRRCIALDALEENRARARTDAFEHHRLIEQV